MRPAISESVPILDLELNERLTRASKALVRNKYLLDTSVADHGASMLARDLHDGGYGPHEGPSFLRRTIPFYKFGDRTSDFVFALVPTAHTLGCSWKWRRTDLDSDEAERRRKELTSTESLLAETINPAQYTWIKALGLIAPGEGKNRVDFFRTEGIEFIPAKVYERTYPRPDQIAIYSVKKHGFEDTWAVLDGRWVEKVSNPSWALPIMEAYGAVTGLQWPRDFPAPERVQQAFFAHEGVLSPLGHPDFDEDPIVDLETLRISDAYQAELLHCSAFELNNVKIDPRTWLVAGAGFLVSFAALALAPNGWVDFKVLTGIVLGASLCAGLLPLMAPILIAQRRSVGHNSHLPREMAPKYCEKGGQRHLG